MSFLLILAVGIFSHLSRSCLALALLRASRVVCRTFLPSSWPSCRVCSSGWRPGFLRHPIATLWPSSQPTLMLHLRSPPLQASAISSPVEALRLQGQRQLFLTPFIRSIFVWNSHSTWGLCLLAAHLALLYNLLFTRPRYFSSLPPRGCGLPVSIIK